MKIATKYLNSIWFTLTICIITFVSYIFNVPFFSFYTLLISLVVILIFKTDFKNVVPLIILLYANHRCVFERKYDSPAFIGLFVMLGVVILIFLIRIIQNRKIIYEILLKDLIFYSLVAIFCSMLLSLINTPDLPQSLIGICLWIIIMLSYVLVRTTVSISEKNIHYVLLSIILSSWVLSLEVLHFIVLDMKKGCTFESILQIKEMSLVWGNINHIAAFINISLLISFYVFIKYKGIISKVFTVVSIILFLGISLISCCRGGYLALLIVLPLLVLCFFIYKTAYDRLTVQNFSSLLAIVLGVSILLVILNLTGVMGIVIDNLLNKGFRSSSRFKVYSIALNQFKKHPIIGPGVYSSRYYLLNGGFNLYNYHNHYLQILGTCGIIGTLSFTLFLFASLKRTIKKDIFSIFVLIIIIYFLVHGAVDTLYFNAYIMPLHCVLLALIPEVKHRDRFTFIKKVND